MSGDLSNFVGYAAIGFHKPFSLTPVEKAELLKLVRTAIEESLQKTLLFRYGALEFGEQKNDT